MGTRIQIIVAVILLFGFALGATIGVKEALDTREREIVALRAKQEAMRLTLSQLESRLEQQRAMFDRQLEQQRRTLIYGQLRLKRLEGITPVQAYHDLAKEVREAVAN